MNRPIVLAEWKRATESLGAARSCHRDRFYPDSVSRAYYAVLHAAKAALQMQNIEAATHAAAKRLFGLHVVQAKLVEAEWGTYLGESSEARLMADYDVEVDLSEEEAHEEYERARAFLMRIRVLLLAKGFTTEELHSDAMDA